jgi:hypothetical protein
VPPWSRTSLREIFLEIWQTHRDHLDTAVVDWLRTRVFQPPPEHTPEQVWASHLQDVFRAVAAIPLPKVDRMLRDEFRDFRSWLCAFRYAESCDPEAAFLYALAWATTNRDLEGMWQSLALRQDREPVYYSDIGLLGLRKSRDEQGNLPQKAPFLLLATILDLADAGMPRDAWEETTMALLASYHWSTETWVREFQPVLALRQGSSNGSRWLRRLLPLPAQERETEEISRKDLAPAHRPDEKDSMIAQVAERGPNEIGRPLSEFLEAERTYTRLTRNSHFLVRTFNRLAEAARPHDPDWALARAEEALAWDERNARNWTVVARCLWTRGRRAVHNGGVSSGRRDCSEAIDTL